jgi:hypothetical protein
MNRQRTRTNRAFPILVGTVNPKMIVAAVLLTLMGGLWLRVLLRGRSGPARAGAQSVSLSAAASMNEPAAKSVFVQPVSLPVVAGRHDRLQGNPFVLDPSRWSRPDSTANLQADGKSPADAQGQKHEANLQRISQRLVLEAVVRDPDGVPIKACVDGTVLFKGSTFKVKENGEQYELNVKEIRATEVRLSWQVYDLTIKMPSSEWLD